MIGLPPATCGQVSEVPIVNAKPLITPMMPPISTQTRIGLLGNFERLKNLLAGHRGEDARLGVTRPAQAFDSVYAFLLVGENADDLR